MNDKYKAVCIVLVAAVIFLYGIYRINEQFLYLGIIFAGNYLMYLVIALLGCMYSFIKYRHLWRKALEVYTDPKTWVHIFDFKIPSFFIQKLQPSFKKDAVILIDSLFDEDAECIDAYSLFLFMRKNNMPAYYVIWRKSKSYDTVMHTPHSKNIITVHKQHGTDFLRKAFWKLLRCKQIIYGFLAFSNFDQPLSPIVPFLKSNKYITNIYLNHGVTFFKEDLPYYPSRFDKLIVSNEIEKEIYVRRMAWKASNILMAGLPRWDLLRKTEQHERNVLIFFTWRTSCLEKKDYKNSVYYKKIISLINNQKLAHYCTNHNIKLVCGLHHALFNHCGLSIKINCPDHVELANLQHLSAHIVRSDMLITDFSSLAFDFMFLDKPVVFYRPDSGDTWLSPHDLKIHDEARAKDHLIYNACYDELTAVDKIIEIAENGFINSPQNMEINSKFFPYRQNISETIIKQLNALPPKEYLL